MKTATACLAITVCISVPAHAQLRVVSWNTLGEARTGTSTVLEAIGDELTAGVIRPIDVLSLQEQNTSGSDTASIVSTLNTIYGAGTYAAAPGLGVTAGAGRPGLVYNTETVDLIGQIAFGTVNTSAQARQTLRYQLRPDGYNSDADFYVYSNHYKASTGATNEARRNVEATALRANLDGLGDGVSAILSGDYNIRSSFEQSYQTLLGPGNGQAFDPIDTPGVWHNSSALRHTHTQSPVTSSNFPGQVTGGIDDRFDFQLVTGELLDGEGLDFIDGSYRAFGNNGTHLCCNSPISGTGASATVLEALRQASDHLPVVADYQLPAVLFAEADGPTSGLVFDQGESASLDVLISNAVDALSSTTGDELEWALNVSGALSGFGSGTALAAAAATVQSVLLDTSTVGPQTGTIEVTSSSPGEPVGIIGIPVSFEVVATSIPGDFDGDGDVDQDDFGVFVLGFQNSPTGGPPFDPADFDGDGDVDLDDFGVFVLGFQNFPPPSVAVPEPASIVLALALIPMHARRRS